MKIPRVVIVITVILILYKARLDALSYKKAVVLSNDAHTIFIDNVLEHVEKAIESTKWQSLLGSIETILDESHFAQIPALFSLGAQVLVERVEVSARLALDQKEMKVTKDLNDFLDVNLGVVTKLVTTKLRKEIEGYTSDHKILQNFEKNVALVPEDKIVDSTREVILASSAARFVKLRSIFNDALSWKLKSYERFLQHTTRIRFQLNPASQLEMWVELSTQKIIGPALNQYLSATKFEEYTSSSDFIDFLDSKFSEVSKSDFASDLESFFSLGTRHIITINTILGSQYTEVYTLLLQAIESDAVLDVAQKKVLNTFARGVKDESEASGRTSYVTDITEVETHFEYYAHRLLREIRVVILVAYLEYKMISFRAAATGKLTCIVEFYDMRKAINAAFFFEYARERSFDLEKTQADFKILLNDHLEMNQGSVFSLVDTSYIHYLFEATKGFLLSRLNLFFFDDVHLFSLLKPMMETLHKSYADIIPKRIQDGIDKEITQQVTMATVYIESAFARFIQDMEFSLSLDLINGSRSSILEDIVEKVEAIHAELSNLPSGLSREFLQPFGSEYFKATTASFVTDEVIDFIGMKKFVVDETVSYAASAVEKTRTTYREAITSLFVKVDDFINDVYSDLVLHIESQGNDSMGILLNSASLANTSMLSFSKTIKDSTMVRVEEVLRLAMEEVQDAQQVRLYNYFNTKIQVIKIGFTEHAVSVMSELFDRHVEGIEEAMLQISGMARGIFRASVDGLLRLESDSRSEIVSVSKPFLDEQVVYYVKNYNIVSFSARQSIFKADLRRVVMDSASDVILQRRLAVAKLGREWAETRLEFRNMLFDTANSLNASFLSDLNVIIRDLKDRAVDIMGEVDEVLDALDRDFSTSLQSTFAAMVDGIVGTTDNDLPEELSMEAIVFTPGIMDLTTHPEIPADAFKRSYREQPDEDTLYDEEMNILPEVDKPSGYTTPELFMLVLEWDLWIRGRVDEIVYDVVEGMTDVLTQNTCRNKPPCREGWVEEENLHGVLCCIFNPEVQGFKDWEIAGMLAFEITLGLLLDVENLSKMSAYFADTAMKTGYKVGKGIGNSALASASRRGGQMVSKSFYKYAGKNSVRMTKAISLAGKTAGKKMAKAALYAGQKSGATTAAKMVATKGFSKLLKIFLKGPAGVALFIYDAVSLILDLWDPAGYNDQQNAALMRVERDMVEEYYKDYLHNSGYDSPLLADPMYNMSPGEKNRLWDETRAEWESERMAEFLRTNESKFELLAEWEQQNEIMTRLEDLGRELDENPNIVTTLVSQKLENVFLQDLSTRENHQNPHTDGGSNSNRTHVRQHLPPSGILEISLNETGVEAFNAFANRKAHFMQSFKYNPFYRYVRRENDYMVTADTSVASILKAGVKCEIKVRQTAGEYSSTYAPYYNYETIEDCVLEAYPLLTPTPEGSLAFADALKEMYGRFGEFGLEIRAMVDKGWVLNKVDAEEEFWVQFDSSKSDLELLDRKKYQKAHEELAKANKFQYESLMDNTIALHVDQNLTPEDAEKVSINDIKVIHLAQFAENWTSLADGTQVLKYPLSEEIDDAEKITYTVDNLPTVPSWVPPYQEMFETYEGELEAGFKEVHDENMRLLGEAYEDAQEKEEKRLDDKAAEENKSVKEIISDESVLGRSSEPDPPDFAVFLNGYGQISPLWSIANECHLMGHGVTYDHTKGLCNFTESYCDRYGVDFFYNQGLAVFDCELSRGQMVLEYIFGTTISRSVKRGWHRYDENGNLMGYTGYSSLGSTMGSTQKSLQHKKIGTCRKALGLAKINGVEVKQVQNGENLNHVGTTTTLQVIAELGLSGF